MKGVDLINAVANKAHVRSDTRLKDDWKSVYGWQTRPGQGKTQEGGLLKCKFCAKSHEFRKELCPAWGRGCNKCENKNNFSISLLCRAIKGRGNALQDNSDSDRSSDAEQIHKVETVCSLPHYEKDLLHDGH